MSINEVAEKEKIILLKINLKATNCFRDKKEFLHLFTHAFFVQTQKNEFEKKLTG